MGYFNSTDQQPSYSAGFLPCEPFPECLAPPFTITVGEKDQTQPEPVKQESKTKQAIVAIIVATVPTVLGGYLVYRLTREEKPKTESGQVKEPPPKNRTYQYAKAKYAEGKFPWITIVYELDEYWTQDENFKLLDGPFKTRGMAETHRSRALDKAIKTRR